MTPVATARRFRYRIVVAIVGVLLLGLGTFLAPPTPTQWLWLAIALVFAFEANFPFPFLLGEFTLAHITALGMGLLLGPVVTGWALLLGMVLGYVIRQVRLKAPARLWKDGEWLAEASFAFGLQALPLSLALQTTGWHWGLMRDVRLVVLPGALPPMLLFAAAQAGLLALDVLDRFLSTSSVRPADLPRYLWVVFFIESLPLAYVGLGVLLYARMPVGAALILLGLPAILSVFLYRLGEMREELERRMQELSTLDKISRVVRSTLNLENLLAVIHHQVTQLLAVEHFYVALYDAGEDRLWYPLAVKYGQRQSWPPRSLQPDRLTDRVIREARPMVMASNASQNLGTAGLPTSVDTPRAWIGVPLITAERVIGCLAVYAVTPGTEFTSADLNLLTILSGQVSVAIENALLYEQAQRRAQQLESLNGIMALITASLDTEKVLSQVCRSAAQVAEGNHSAIYLLDAEKGCGWLAHTFGLSSEFTRRNQTFDLQDGARTRCLDTHQPVLNADLSDGKADTAFARALRAEGIQACGEFPLITPGGHIGILSVYFDAPHHFPSDEVELLQLFASQAAMAVSNARLYASADQALARRVNQLSILETVGRELGAAINSSRLFEMILDYAMQYTNSGWGELTLYDAVTETLEVKASRGYAASVERFPLSQGLSGQAVVTRQPVNIGDTHKAPGYLDMTGGKARSQLSIPMIHEGRVLGVISLESAQENAYPPNDQAFISQLAVQAAVAVVNAELYSQTQRRLREQSILYLISTRLVSNPELESVLQTAARSVEAAIAGVAVGIYLWEEGDSAYRLRYNLPAPGRPECQLPASVVETRLHGIRPALMNTGLLRLSEDEEASRALLGACTHCRVVVFPLVVKRQRLGMILLHTSTDHLLQEDEMQLLHGMGSQVSIALQNALLFDDVMQGRDRLTAVLNSVGEGLLMIESEGRILLANEAVQAITGLKLKNIVGSLLTDLPLQALQTLGYTRPEAESLVRSLEEGQTITTPKTTLKIAEPKPERIVERSTTPVWGQGGRAIGWMIVLRDITEETQIAEAREMINQTLVHDLRSPIGAASSAIEIVAGVLPDELAADELVDQALRVARNSLNRVLGLVESLLDIARLRSGRMELNLVPLDIRAMAASAIGDLLPQANEAEVILRYDIPEGFPALRADQGKIARVLTNLLDNALKFTPSGGQVCVSAEIYPRDMAAIRVSDSGPGIPDEFREKIFDRFTQVPGQRGRRRGSGLGLTFCRLAVEAHGGRIWVEPRPGGGSIFSFTLPIASSGQGFPSGG